jgi:inosine-uridine nucleoside N-ribohydrolase
MVMRYSFCLVLTSLLIAALGIVPSTTLGSDKTSVWVDADPACGLGQTDDVDDCWAILYAINSNKMSIRGLSTVFGNTSVSSSYQTANLFLQKISEEGVDVPSVYKGSGSSIEKGKDVYENEATIALYNELKERKISIIALGPLTNIAILIQLHPEIAKNIVSIVAVAGSRPKQRRFFIGNSNLLHFHDLNFNKDPIAFEIVLNSGIPLTLIPFEVATKVTVTSDDLQIMGKRSGSASWLTEHSKGWLDFWSRSFGIDGFYPFDFLAVGYQLMPSEFQCEMIPTQIEWHRSLFFNRNALLASYDLNHDRKVNYCIDVSMALKDSLLNLQL